MSRLNKFFLFFLATAFLATAQQPQEVLSGVSARPAPQDQPSIKRKSSVFLQLPFFDDFSYRRNDPSDSLWEDNHVFVNQTYAQSPPTLGMATFDGLNRYGRPYDISHLGTDSADVLTSRGIDLSTAQDSTYLSFFYQPGGLGEEPESEDSLSLYFFSPVTNSWSWAWGVDGGDTNTDFSVVRVPVNDAIYLQPGFKFRFVSFGAQAGAFDTWNLDYILLDDQRNYNSTPFIRKDPAFTRPFPSLITDYQAMPWFHYLPTLSAALNKQDLILYYQRNARSNPPTPADRYSLSLGVYQVRHNGGVLAQDLQGSAQLDNNHGYFNETAYSYPLKDFTLPSTPTEEFSIKAFHTYNGLNEVGSNDTIYRNQVFSNYYAYDDGSAERAYHVTDNEDGVILTYYDVVLADVVRGAYFYFLPAEFDAEDNEFTIVIYENNQGIPGNLLYESDSVYTAQYSAHNFFIPYALDDTNGVSVTTDGFFIGLRQVGRGPLPIGFDMNTTGKSDIFFGEPGNLFKSFQPGTIMIRPFLRNLPDDLSQQEGDLAEHYNWQVYPNPTDGVVYLEGLEPGEQLNFQLIDLTGRVVQQGEAHDRLDFTSAVKKGFYLLRLHSAKSGNTFTTKILIR